MKLSLGVLGLSAMAIPTTWIVITAEPSSTTLRDDSVSKYTNKFGEDFGHQMISKSSDKWWGWSFKKRYQQDDTKHDFFKDIKNGEDLKKKCVEAYGKDTSKEIKDKDDYSTSVWRYCSFVGKKPVSASNKQSSENDPSRMWPKYKDIIISSEETQNSQFWEIQEREFLKKKALKGTTTDNKTSLEKIYDEIPDPKLKRLSYACGLLHTRSISEVSQDVLRFCSLNPQEKIEIPKKSKRIKIFI